MRCVSIYRPGICRGSSRTMLWALSLLLAGQWLPASLGAEEPASAPWRKAPSAADAGWSAEKLAEARALADTLDTAAVMIIHHGVIVDEWGPTALPLMCHSVRKSLLSALYGTHVERGAIRLDSTLRQLGINDNEPALSEIELGATVGDLLKARSGVYHPALYETKSMAEKRPKRGAHRPGEFWYYNNWDFNALGTIFDQLVGTSLFEEFEARLARPLGMQDFRRSRDTNYVAGKDSNHRAYPFLLSARDLARFGQLMLQRGQWQGTRLVSADWVRESTQSYSDTGASGGYGYMWWVAAAGRHFPN
ncbi:MAG: serine hydrolase, partial [Planctomycetales bacterium]|nr:serine hydrolase [Planctomycetales bacterium]